MPEARISSGALSANVSSRGVHGWCGLGDLKHRANDREWLVRPALTLEHYLGVPMDSPDYIEYEPFTSRRSLRNIRADGCTLRYGPKDCCRIECTIDYQIVSPHYVDVLATANVGRQKWPHGYAALFFATIVDAPLYSGINILGRDPALSFKRANPWVHFNGSGVTPGLTIHPSGAVDPALRRPDAAPDVYYFSDSSIRFDAPMFYGLVDEMMFGVLFKESDRERVRFTVNPASAFGAPAWDFFWIIENPSPARPETLAFRVVWKPFVSRDDVLAEFDTYNRISSPLSAD